MRKRKQSTSGGEESAGKGKPAKAGGGIIDRLMARKRQEQGRPEINPACLGVIRSVYRTRVNYALTGWTMQITIDGVWRNGSNIIEGQGRLIVAAAHAIEAPDETWPQGAIREFKVTPEGPLVTYVGQTVRINRG